MPKENELNSDQEPIKNIIAILRQKFAEIFQIEKEKTISENEAIQLIEQKIDHQVSQREITLDIGMSVDAASLQRISKKIKTIYEKRGWKEVKIVSSQECKLTFTLIPNSSVVSKTNSSSPHDELPSLDDDFFVTKLPPSNWIRPMGDKNHRATTNKTSNKRNAISFLKCEEGCPHSQDQLRKIRKNGD